MPIVKSRINSSFCVELPNKADGFDLIESIMDVTPGNTFSDLILEGFYFNNITRAFMHIRGTIFKECTFRDCDLSPFYFEDCELQDCEMFGDKKWWLDKDGLEYTGKEKDLIKNMPTNEEIESRFKCKCHSLPNKAYVKVEWVCDFCHKHTFSIYRRDKVSKEMCDVPNCDKKVCAECYRDYKLSEKFAGCRTYGYRGDLHKYTTPMDRTHTEILGLEMEFEGDFYGWKELQDAHQGMLHYGYDSSVIGQNELSWDCGSYSWWKYLSTLKNVCNVLGKYGGKAGDSAGIHIHVSRDNVAMPSVTQKINKFGRTIVGKILFKAISLRNNVEKFDMYSNLDTSETAHHAGISYNSYNTCEFRLFNSTLDYKLILKHLKFCKEVFGAFADNKSLFNSFSPETITHIKNCAGIQKDKGFITEAEYKTLMKKFTTKE